MTWRNLILSIPNLEAFWRSPKLWWTLEISWSFFQWKTNWIVLVLHYMIWSTSESCHVMTCWTTIFQLLSMITLPLSLILLKNIETAILDSNSEPSINKRRARNRNSTNQILCNHRSTHSFPIWDRDYIITWVEDHYSCLEIEKQLNFMCHSLQSSWKAAEHNLVRHPDLRRND